METSHTVRFSELVKKSGKPQVVTLWADPKRDKPFMDATKHNRVLTVSQRMRGKKDRGEVGFHPHPLAVYLLFPKPLAEKAGTQIVGIKYELLEPVSLEPASRGRQWKPEKPFKARATRPAPTKEITFQAKGFRTLGQEFNYKIEAVSAAVARKEALSRLQTEAAPHGTKVLSSKVSQVKERE